MSGELILFVTLAVISVASAAAMILNRNAVYSALYLVLNFVTIALFYLILGGAFIALAQIVVYAGAIMVLFLFVIMLLGVETLPIKEATPWQRPLAIGLGVALLIEAAYILFLRPTPGISGSQPPLTDGFGGPKLLADVLFNQYSLPVEVVGILLLVAMVGVIVMVKNIGNRQSQ
jgi:NADH-quinone oxidoreductase subunit J